MKILYVSQYFPPEMGAPAARVSELARYWVEAGHEVTVLTGFPNHPTGVVPPEYRGKLRRLVLRERFAGARVLRTWLWPLPNRKSHERMRNYSSFALSAAIAGSFVQRPDVVIATSPQLLVGLTGWWISRVKRVPFVFEVRDLWPESLAAVGVSGERSLLVRMLRRVSSFLYRRADRIAVVTPAFRESICRDYGIAAEKISLVENGVDTELFRPDADQGAAREALKGDGGCVVSYIGTIGNAHGLETLLEAAERLPPEVNARFVLLGEGAEKEMLVAQARRRGLGNVIFLSQQPRERVPGFIAASDICVVLLKDTPVFRTVIPTKMLEMMSCGRPVVLGVDGMARQVLEAAHAGIAVPPGNAAALADAIGRLARDPGLRAELGRNGRHYIERDLSRRSTAARYMEVLQSVARVAQPAQRAVGTTTSR